MKNYGKLSDKISGLLHGGDYNPEQWLDVEGIIPEDVRLMKLSGTNCVSVGIFSWKVLEPHEGEYNFKWLDQIMDLMYANGIHVILATPSGAKPVWMAEKYPETLRVDSCGVRQIYGKRHNHCPSSLIYRKKVAEIDRKLAERYKDHPALIMWHISNEFEGECHCELCQAKFRNWLRNKYDNDISKLNNAWWAKFWSHEFSDFEEIHSPSPIGEPWLHGLNLDWKRFTTDNMVDYCKSEIDVLKSITPDIPCTTNFHDFVSNLELDYWKFAPILDVISWDNYPYWHSSRGDYMEGSRRAFIHDLNRSFKGGKPFMMMESSPSSTNWQPVAKLRRPGMHRVQSLQAIAHGSDTVQYFQWRKSRGSSEKFHGAVVDHCGHENTRVFREVSHVGASLSRLADIAGTSVEAEAAVIFDWENFWAMSDAQGPREEGKDYWDTCQSHYRGFWQNNVPVDIINEDCDFSKYKVIAAPMLYMVRQGVGERLTEFVKNGGTLITTYWSGIVDENDLCYLGGFPGPIKDICGIWSEEIDALYDGEKNPVSINCQSPISLSGTYDAEVFCDLIHTEGAVSLGEYTEDFYAGMPALTYNSCGKGGVYYIAFRNNSSFIDDFYSEIIKSLHLKKAIDIALPQGVNAQTRYDEKNKFVFLLNFSGEEKTVDLPHGIYADAENAEPADSVNLNPFDVRIIKELNQ